MRLAAVRRQLLVSVDNFYNLLNMTERASPTFPSTALSQDTGTVLAEAARGPVVLTHYRKPRYALMSFDEYERLKADATVREGDAQRAVRLDEVPPGELGAFVASVDDQLAE